MELNGAGQSPEMDNSGTVNAQAKEVSSADFLTELTSDGRKWSGNAPLAHEGQTTQEGDKEQLGSPPATEPKLPGFTAAATKELRSDPRFNAWASKFKSFDDAVKSAMELESKMGAMAAIPGNDATPEQKTEFYKRIGVPESIDQYELPRAEGLQYDEASEEEFREMAMDLNLTNEQAQGLYNYASERALDIESQVHQSEAEQQQAVIAERESTESALRREWGDDYNANRDVLKRGYTEFVTPEFSKRLQQRGMGNDPDMMRLLYTLGKTVMEDPGAFGRTTSSGPNGAPQLEYPGL